MLAVRMFGSINANIIIVFTPIKIPNKLTLIIYIIRSEAAGKLQKPTQQIGERNIQISFVFTKCFEPETGWERLLAPR